MYYIQKFSDSWSLLDTAKNVSRPIEKQEIDFLMKMFPGLFENKVLTYVEVLSIQPNKLMKMNTNNKPKPTQKPGNDNGSINS